MRIGWALAVVLAGCVHSDERAIEMAFGASLRDASELREVQPRVYRAERADGSYECFTCEDGEHGPRCRHTTWSAYRNPDYVPEPVADCRYSDPPEDVIDARRDRVAILAPSELSCRPECTEIDVIERDEFDRPDLHSGEGTWVQARGCGIAALYLCADANECWMVRSARTATIPECR